MHRVFRHTLIFIIVTILVSACGLTQRSTSIDQSTNIQSDTTTPYPYPVNTPFVNYLETAYPQQLEQQTTASYMDAITVPTPNNATGIVIGQLVIEGENDKPYLAPTLFLGSALNPSNPEYPPLISLNIEGDPKAIQDKTGRFVFTEVQQGKYGLIIWSPYTQTVITDPKNQENPLVINVVQGEIVDLGKISVP